MKSVRINKEVEKLLREPGNNSLFFSFVIVAGIYVEQNQDDFRKFDA